MLKKFTPKKASAPTKTPAPKKAAPRKTAPKKPPPKKASAPNKEITSNIKASASHLPPVPKKTFTAKKIVEADIEDFDLEEYKASAQDTLRHSHSFSVHSSLFRYSPPRSRHSPSRSRRSPSRSRRSHSRSWSRRPSRRPSQRPPLPRSHKRLVFD